MFYFFIKNPFKSMLHKSFILIALVLGNILSAGAYTEQGVASYYHDMFHGRTTANGEKFDQHKMSAAHKSLPFNSIVKVTRKDNGHFIIVRINDRGPYVKGRIIDLSKKAGQELGILGSGTTGVSIEVINSTTDESITAAALRMRNETNISAPKPTRPATYKSPNGYYEISSSTVFSSFEIVKIVENTLNFKYVSINTATNCKIDIEGEASLLLNSETYFELEGGSKIKIKNFLFVYDNTELTIGVSDDNQRIILSKRSNQGSTTDECQFFSDAWLDRKKVN